MRKCDVGGQAVIEGVMMRGSKGMATAIRTPKGKIKVSVKKTVSLTKKYKILSLPFIRGITALLDSLIIGIKTLNYSASFFEEEEEESAFETATGILKRSWYWPSAPQNTAISSPV